MIYALTVKLLGKDMDEIDVEYFRHASFLGGILDAAIIIGLLYLMRFLV